MSATQHCGTCDVYDCNAAASQPTCPRWGCGGLVVVAKIMRWCPKCKWTGLA